MFDWAVGQPDGSPTNADCVAVINMTWYEKQCDRVFNTTYKIYALCQNDIEN